MIDKVYLCAICNIESGTCSEDCKFCTQSVKYQASIQRYKHKEIKQIVNEAKIAYKNKAIGYCLVTAGVGLDDKKLDFVCKAASAVKKEVPNISLIGCNGIASKEQLKELKNDGIEHYNHNLETSKEYYNQICTTHTWESRYQTCLNVKEVGLNLCCGGIFGMGETQKDRLNMLKSIKELEPLSVPINFFHPNKALPINKNNISRDESFNLIKLTRETLGDEVMIMVAGGRENMFQEQQYEIFKYGANSIVIGNYLTTNGKVASLDLDNLEKLNLSIAKDCNR